MTETSAATVALRMRGVRKAFGPVVALAGVDLEVRAGEVHALIGENGAGKSTLMKVLAGAHAPDEGQLELLGEAFAPKGPVDSLQRGVAMIYQELCLAPHLSVEENVMLGRERTRFGLTQRNAMRVDVQQALKFLDHEDIDPRTRVGDLGPGARQLVEIARALVGDVRVLVLDEPTSSLSRQDTERLFAVIRRLAADGVAVVYISHFLEEVQRIAERYTVLRDGETVATGEVAGTTVEQLVEAMVGRGLDEVFPEVPHERGAVLLSLSALAGSDLPREASLDLHRGEVFGIAGLVGAGRTELLRALFGLDVIKSGRITMAGVDAGTGTPRGRLDQGIGLLSEDRKEEGLALGMSLAENTTLSRMQPFTRFGFLSRRAQERSADIWMQRLGVRARDSRQSVGELSGGNQQKIAIARLLHHDVDVLLLDEPTRGIDVGSKVEVYRLIGELAASGKALLIVSSYMPELLGVCDRVAVMHRGVLGPAREAEGLSESDLLDEATRGRLDP